MMPEISLNILDVAQNSVTAGAGLIELTVAADTAADTLTVVIADNGCGMSPELVARVTDPFCTTRTTRKVGLGIPFLKMAAEITGGQFSIRSAPQQGTTTTAVFGLRHIDRMPLGDIAGTLVSLVGPNPDRDFVLRYSVDHRAFEADTRAFREILGPEVPLSSPEVLSFLADFVNEHLAECGAPL